MTASTPIGGFVAPGFEPVADAFADNFTRRGEHGAAFAAFADGRPVVDLWGGEAAPGSPWREETLQLLFSGTKGLVATCLLLLVERGLLDLDAPVAAYWPEFAAAGKEHVTVAELASHRARLPAVRTPLERADLLDGRRLARLLAAQPQERDPRAASVYHPLTYGWLCGELIRRVDGRTAGRLLAEEIAAPLGLELWLGLPARHEPRLSRLRYGAAWGGAAIYAPAPADDELLRAIWANPPLFPPADEPLPWNERAFHAAEIGGANAVGSARAVARLYGCLARGGAIDGLWLLSPETLTRGLAEQVRFEEPFAGDQLVYGIGFQLQNDAHAFGPPTEAFGHTGAGGSVHGGWPRERVGFSYAMNELRDLPDGDPRPRALLEALHDALPAAARPATGGGVSAPVALVTGAAGGIGAAVVDRLAADGFEVVAVDLREPPSGSARVTVDLTTRAGNRAAVDAALERFGRLDVVVANAGVQHVAPVAEFPEEQWDRLLALLLTSPFLLAKYAWPALVASPLARLVVVASAHALAASPYKSAYVSAKHGVIGLVKTLALEGADAQIMTSAICPAFVRTPLVEAQIAAQAEAHGLPEERVLEEVILAPHAVKRLIEPSEVADLVGFVAGPGGATITGTALPMDMGWTAR